MSLRSKASQDVKAAERKARQTASRLQSKARQDVRAAERRVRDVDRQDVRNAAERVSQVETPDLDSGQTAKDIGDRAYRAGQAPAVVDASLDPGPDGPGMQLFASSGGVMDEGLITGGRRRERGMDRPERQPQRSGFFEPPSGEPPGGFLAAPNNSGPPPEADGGSDEPDDPLAFDDAFGLGGGL